MWYPSVVLVKDVSPQLSTCGPNLLFFYFFFFFFTFLQVLLILKLTMSVNIISSLLVPVQQLWVPLIDFMNLVKNFQKRQSPSLNKVENPEDLLHLREMTKVSSGTWEVT